MWWPHARLTAKFDYRVNLLAYWQVGEKEPWLLSTNLTTAAETVRTYRRRMWTEELFGDLKGHGFDLASTHLDQFARLSRLTLWESWCMYGCSSPEREPSDGASGIGSTGKSGVT